MQWHCEDHSLRNAQPSWPILDDTALALVVNGAPHARLLTEESELADSMSNQRLMDFTSGRHSAHIAQRLLGLEEQPILRVNRSPLWPPGQCGSISHCREWAFAGVSTQFRSIGVDIEAIDRSQTSCSQRCFGQTKSTPLTRSLIPRPPSRFLLKKLDTRRFSLSGPRLSAFKKPVSNWTGPISSFVSNIMVRMTSTRR